MNASNGFMPMFQGMMPVMPILPVMPVMPFAQNDNGASGEDAASNMKKFWEQMIDVQKTSMNTAKDQWTRFFEYMMDMQDTFAESLPDELPTLPGFPQPAVSPKEFMKQLKGFQEMANEYFVKQADTAADFTLKGQEKVCDVVNQAMENAQKTKE